MKTYSEKLKDPRWQKKRLEILNRDQFKCCLCEDDKTELHVHHLKYNGQPWDAQNEFLQTLCKYCHKYISDFERDVEPEYKHKITPFVKAVDDGGLRYFLNSDGNIHVTGKILKGLDEYIFFDVYTVTQQERILMLSSIRKSLCHGGK